MILETAVLRSPVGPLRVWARGGALCALAFDESGQSAGRWLTRRFGPCEEAIAPDPAGAITALGRYLKGDLHALDALAVDPGGTSFQADVWRALRRIPPGATASYGEIAAAIGKPTAVRAVGAANRSNPIGIVIPCHRVIGKDGTLTGYAGGLSRKEWLLAHEGIEITPRLQAQSSRHAPATGSSPSPAT